MNASLFVTVPADAVFSARTLALGDIAVQARSVSNGNEYVSLTLTPGQAVELVDVLAPLLVERAS